MGCFNLHWCTDVSPGLRLLPALVYILQRDELLSCSLVSDCLYMSNRCVTLCDVYNIMWLCDSTGRVALDACYTSPYDGHRAPGLLTTSFIHGLACRSSQQTQHAAPPTKSQALMHNNASCRLQQTTTAAVWGPPLFISRVEIASS